MRPKVSEKLAARLMKWYNVEKRDKQMGYKKWDVSFEEALDLILQDQGY